MVIGDMDFQRNRTPVNSDGQSVRAHDWNNSSNLHQEPYPPTVSYPWHGQKSSVFVDLKFSLFNTVGVVKVQNLAGQIFS